MLRARIETALRGVLDPETGRDLIAMGMIGPNGGEDGRVTLALTPTSRGCPMAEMLRLGVEAAVLAVEGVRAAEVRLLWEPPWTPERMAPP